MKKPQPIRLQPFLSGPDPAPLASPDTAFWCFRLPVLCRGTDSMLAARRQNRSPNGPCMGTVSRLEPFIPRQAPLPRIIWRPALATFFSLTKSHSRSVTMRPSFYKSMMSLRLWLAITIGFALTQNSAARIGDTYEQCIKRYGKKTGWHLYPPDNARKYAFGKVHVGISEKTKRATCITYSSVKYSNEIESNFLANNVKDVKWQSISFENFLINTQIISS